MAANNEDIKRKYLETDFFTQGEFGKMCGITGSQINEDVRRGKLTCVINPSGEDSYVDIKNPKVKEYLETKRANSEKADRPILQASSLIAMRQVQIARGIREFCDSLTYFKTHGKPKDESREGKKEKNQAERKREAEVKKAEADAEYAELRVMKMQGESVPTVLVEDLMNRVLKAYVDSFKNAAEKHTSIVIHELGGDSSDRARLSGKLDENINAAIKTASLTIEKDVESMVEDYTNKLGRGEKRN